MVDFLQLICKIVLLYKTVHSRPMDLKHSIIKELHCIGNVDRKPLQNCTGIMFFNCNLFYLFFMLTVSVHTKGVQSRSRAVLAYAQVNNAPCPEQLWESRPCEASACFSFMWKTSAWTKQLGRTVWCERSDGLLVTGKHIGVIKFRINQDFLI